MFYLVNRNLGQEAVQGHPIDQDDNNESLVARQPDDSKNDPSKNMAFMERLVFLLWYKVKSLKAF